MLPQWIAKMFGWKPEGDVDETLMSLRQSQREVGHRLRNIEQKLEPIERLIQSMREDSDARNHQH